MVLLLWIFYVFVLSCVCYVFVQVCLYLICGHLLGKGWPPCSRLWCLTVSLSLSLWYPGSGVVLDCIDSWSLHTYLLFSFNMPYQTGRFFEYRACADNGITTVKTVGRDLGIVLSDYWVNVKSAPHDCVIRTYLRRWRHLTCIRSSICRRNRELLLYVIPSAP